MESKSFHENYFESIQALRGISALFVILEHIRFLNCGAFGVDIFFCISGFMIMFSTHKHTRHFLIRRLIRILPLYYLMTVGTYLLLLLFPSLFEQSKADPVFLLKSLLFIPFDIGGGILQPLMRIGWTINCEIFFYILFAVSLRISHRFRGLICSIFLILVILTSQLVSALFSIEITPLQFYGNPIMAEFILGIACYYMAKSIYHLYQKDKIPHLFPFFCLLSALGIFVLLVYTKPSINILGARRFLFWGIPAMLLLLLVFTAGLYLKMPRLSVRLGDMSFSVYLIHYYPIMFLDRKIFDFSVYTPHALFGALTGIVLCLLLSYICFWLFEKKLTGWLLSALPRRK